MNAQFIFSDDTTAASEILIEDATKTQVFYSDLQQADNSYKFKIPYDISLVNLIKADLQNNIKVHIINDEGKNDFTGYVRKTASFEKTQTNQPPSLELVSPSFLLDQTVESGKVYIEKSVTFIITQLLALVGFTDIGTIGVDATISVCTISEDDNIKDDIDEILKEHNKTWDFDNDGLFQTKDIFDIPDTEDITQEFTGTENTRESIKIESKEKDADYVEGTWDKIELKKNTLLFSDTSNQTDSKKCVETINAKSYFADTQYNYLDYDSTYGDVVYTSSISPKVKKESGITVSITRTDEDGNDLGTQCMMEAYNSNSYEADIIQLDIYGNAYITTATNSNVSSTGTKKKSVTLDYLHDEASVKTFIANLANWYRYATETISLKSQTKYAYGSFVKISDYGIGTYYGRIIKKVSKLSTKLIEYTIESIAEFTPATISDKKTTTKTNNSASSSVYGDFTAPSTPEISSISLDADSYATLVISPSTDDESGVSYYKIYRKESDGYYSAIASLDHTGSALTYIDKTLIRGFSYSYCVTAIDKKGNVSEKSEVKTVTAAVTKEPNLATSLQALANTTDFIKLTFTAAIADSEANKTACYKIYISRDSGTSWEECGTTYDTLYYYYYDRSIDGYPEKTDLAAYRFKIISVSVNAVESSKGTVTQIDTADYGTWLAEKPSVTATLTGRNITLQISQPDTVYGTVNYRIQIKKLSDTADTSFYKPNLSADSYASLTAYKESSGSENYVTSSNIFSQTLPLNGQTDGTPAATSYQYKITPYTAAGVGTFQTITVSAIPSSAKDLTQSIITENKLADGAVTADKIHAGTITGDKIAATDLSANGAVLGEISGNKIGTSSNNYWKGLDTTTPEFRIGNDIALENSGSESAVYFHFKWVSGVANLAMKLNNFLLTSAASIIKGIFRIKAAGATDANSFLTVNPTSSADSTTSTAAKTVYVKGTVKAASFSGNSSTASKLVTARTIALTDASGTNKGTSISFDGSANKTLKLPATIKAAISGNSSTATVAQYIGLGKNTNKPAYFNTTNPVSNAQPAWLWGKKSSDDNFYMFEPSFLKVKSSTSSATATLATTATTAKKALVSNTLGQNGASTTPMKFYWSGKSGQPSWLWGGSDGTNMYVYNPSNFSVAKAKTCTYPLPVGSIYIQLSGQSTPSSLFGGTWSNVSSSYAGQFFRAEGGNAASFGNTQSQSVQSHTHTIGNNNSSYRLSGLSSSGTRIMQREGTGQCIWKTDAAGSTETRPVNSTVRIWKRTA